MLRCAFIGAGGVNFGTNEGPWDHASRLEKLPDIQFTAVVDPNTDLAERRIRDRKTGAYSSKWGNAKAFSTYQEMLSASRPDVAVIGLQPYLHGSLHDTNADIEVQMTNAGVSLFIEKPLSLSPPEEVAELAEKLLHTCQEKGIQVSVGYMLRYSPAVAAAKRILREHGRPVVEVVARYSAAYSNILKPEWWDTAKSGGPVVEQATHLVDLMLYFGGNIERGSICAVAVGPQLQLSEMPKAPHGEQAPMERRINRATLAVMRFSSGAVGSLAHSALLHGSAYHTELEVLCDGIHIIIRDPYNSPELLARLPGREDYQKVPLENEDMYALELQAFIHAIRNKSAEGILSPYQDAALTYQASQWITQASKTSTPTA